MNKLILNCFIQFHRWGGLIGGWFFYIIIIMGTISIFDREITRWMQPELGVYSYNTQLSPSALEKTYEIWHKTSKQNPRQFIQLPLIRDPFIKILHLDGKFLKGTILNSETGNVISVRDTVGGYFFDNFHKRLFMGRTIGKNLVMTLSIAFIISLISGLIIHLPRLWEDLFKLRPKSPTLRFVLDIHLLISIFLLPFLLVMGISGFLFFTPHSIQILPTPPITHHLEKISNPRDLFSMIQKSETIFSAPAGAIIITPKTITIFRSEESGLTLIKNFVTFNRKTGDIYPPSLQNASTLAVIQRTLFGIHFVKSGGLIPRIIYFILGVLSSIMLACGLLFFTKKRKQSCKKPLSTRQFFIYQGIDSINLSIIMGSLISIIALFWANRLLATSLTQRSKWEILVFFSVFLLCFIHAIFCTFYSNTYKAWQQQIGLFCVLSFLLPFISWFSNAALLKKAIIQGNYLYIMIDFTIFLTSILFIMAYKIFVVRKER